MSKRAARDQGSGIREGLETAFGQSRGVWGAEVLGLDTQVGSGARAVWTGNEKPSEDLKVGTARAAFKTKCSGSGEGP